MAYILVTTLSVFLLGSILHFTHSLPHPKRRFCLLDLISSVNESTWEHMKIFIFGVFIYGVIIELTGLFDINSYLFVAALAAIIAVIAMPLIYNFYMRFLSKNYVLLDISLFFFICLVFGVITWYFYRIYPSFCSATVNIVGFTIWLLLFLVSYIFTFKPPKMSLFYCPVSKDFGHPQRRTH